MLQTDHHHRRRRGSGAVSSSQNFLPIIACLLVPFLYSRCSQIMSCRETKELFQLLNR